MTRQQTAGKGRILSQPYSLLPGDLRDPDTLRTELLAAGFDAQLPTLVLAECVLVYMEVRACVRSASSSAVKFASGRMPCVSSHAQMSACSNVRHPAGELAV